MRVEAQNHSILLVVDCRSETMRKVIRLILHQHLEEVENKTIGARRRTRGMHQERYPSFVTTTRGKTIAFLVVGT
jgi:hypothetical protein